MSKKKRFNNLVSNGIISEEQRKELLDTKEILTRIKKMLEEAKKEADILKEKEEQEKNLIIFKK